MRENTSVLAAVLNGRYGEPSVVTEPDWVQYRWCVGTLRSRSVLYKARWSRPTVLDRYPELKQIYGEFHGGLLIEGALKIALLTPDEIFGLYRLNDLHTQPEVTRALTINPSVCFFMDSANVWFYGVTQTEMYVYDSMTGELVSLGEVVGALQTLLAEWEGNERKERIPEV